VDDVDAGIRNGCNVMEIETGLAKGALDQTARRHHRRSPFQRIVRLPNM
jgi:hypothetical protein